MQQVPGLTLTLDYAHFTRIGLPDAVVEPLVKYASHFHVRGARDERLQETFANNTIDFKRILEGCAGEWIRRLVRSRVCLDGMGELQRL